MHVTMRECVTYPPPPFPPHHVIIKGSSHSLLKALLTPRLHVGGSPEEYLGLQYNKGRVGLYKQRKRQRSALLPARRAQSNDEAGPSILGGPRRVPRINRQHGLHKWIPCSTGRNNLYRRQARRTRDQ